jgi:L-amino acid N-acyltransferase YncA
MHVEIREARLEDAEPIIRILNPIIEAGVYTALDTPLTVQAQSEFIRDFPVRGVFLVAVTETGSRVVGLQSLEPFANYTHAFDHVGVLGTYVDLQFRRQGISTQLFQTTFATAIQKGYEKIFTFVRADNVAGLQAYLTQGFATIGTAARHARISGRYVDEILIEKFLLGSPDKAV